MTMPETKLKPCPFCGGMAVLRQYKFVNYKGKKVFFSVECVNADCMARMPSHSEDKDSVIKRWNRRANENE